MANPVNANATTISFDPDGAATVLTASPVAKGSTVEYDEETQVSDQGPFFGEPVIVEIPTSDKYSMKLSLTVPEGGDIGQNKLMTARVSRTRGTLIVTTTLGLIITMTNCLIKKTQIKVDAKGTMTVDVEASGIGAITVAP